ncbi:hypothetical protein QYF36_022108 [Acer negundo]|nr:hypothetical protein QYF36_022108 [Acer negundo]
MSSSTLFQSKLFSKPRVENFHGSSIKSPGLIMSGHRGDSALAASSGVIGDHRSISSSSYESSALNKQHESSSPVLDFLDTILLLSVLR